MPGGIEIVSDAELFFSAYFQPFLLAGTTWVNVHTQAFPDGEIAGTVRGPKIVPWPAWSWPVAALLVAALGAYLLRPSPRRAR